ncbi:MAG TPA: hypothetical protein DIT89_00715 [Planctomycetaceae bacterium]|nr:hypothetical protein [Planctomycetaceae bacterium]
MEANAGLRVGNRSPRIMPEKVMTANGIPDGSQGFDDFPARLRWLAVGSVKLRKETRLFLHKNLSQVVRI